MTSCAEARFYWSQCGLTRLDGDHDGVFGTLRQRYADLDVAVRRLVSEVPEDGSPSRAAVELVQRRLAALGEALSTPAADG